MKRLILIVTFGLLAFSCATYYQKNIKFNQEFISGRLDEAEKTLNSSKKKAAEGKERFLYFVNQGTVLHLLGRYEESNYWFEKAFIFTEDYSKNYLNEALTFVINPMTTVYPGEDQERLYVLYYKAMNYMKLGNIEAALVECRRLNNLSYRLADKYKSKNKFKEDAFVHNLMGILYESDLNYNDAFIAYRNAYKIYKGEYTRLFSIGPPEQLKKDILRTAYLTGFYDEVEAYEKEFGMKYEHEPMAGKGSLVFFWNNGLGPVKDEWSINFTVVHGGPGFVTFDSPELGGITFPFRFDPGDGDLSDLNFIRVAFPKYLERKPIFTGANLEANGQISTFDLGENVNAISFKVLNERMLATFGKSLLRVAFKQAAAMAAREKNEGLGLAVSLLGAITEKADTRNWQTLPHSIYYTRMALPEGENVVKLNLNGIRNIDQTKKFKYDIRENRTSFQTFFSLESQM
ncbi:COG3014 family protein [Aureibacter tunicatorum]|uniref:Tetratricopeptide repeat protein n=1 Tax=Aureibacter tunicatorum TaxID=866807 RepID=A0AAE3XPB4_9BACT|nr:hypothetical protein [Aureibacter tunicatorum]MDR6239461.1 hypothetical protein [Aureibacter tunicatorum]BDD04617.1 hypothetical protein AUTU_21000 [Aureibacter tunicatorum]